jgi:transposase-like protein
MTLAVAEMYVQGVSTRKVTAIVQELCGLDITSTQVSRAAAELDEQLAAWLEENVPEALTVLSIPASHRRRLRTTNGLERLNKEIKRRTRVATLFPNEDSLLRLASAVLSEISDDWETGRAYLNMEAR